MKGYTLIISRYAGYQYHHYSIPCWVQAPGGYTVIQPSTGTSVDVYIDSIRSIENFVYMCKCHCCANGVYAVDLGVMSVPGIPDVRHVRQLLPYIHT
eukprot:SAG31_NODE_4712_length_3016_cov_1.839218_2_plen_97_part_00